MSLRITWIKPEELLGHELTQARQEGLNVDLIEKRWNQLKDTTKDLPALRHQANQMLDQIAKIPRGDLEDKEPSDYQSIMAQCPGKTAVLQDKLPESQLRDKLLGAWLGRASGCLLGKPVEGKPREWIREILESSGNWPLDNYFTAKGVPPEVIAKHNWHKSSQEALRENIVYMPEDDDMNYPMINLHIAKTYGPSLQPADILQSWLANLPVMSVFTAERVAYFNALQLLTPPETATYHNPYREWIGAQIRADFWGWVAPGNPDLAAKLAYLDASISHVKNGIYGEMFIAAAIAGSFVVDNVTDAITIGLNYVPEKSRLAQAIHFVIDLADREPDFERAIDCLYENYGHYHWVHTINNAALLVAALLYGKGDFEKTICYAVMGGWDTDCNGATVGSLLGVIHGANHLPAKWISPLNNLIRTSLQGFDKSTFDDLTDRTLMQVRVFEKSQAKRDD